MNRKKIMLITSEGQTIKEKKYSSLPWYLARGIESEDVLAAYQAKGAGSYANSIENLVEDTYTLIDTGHAPDWDDTNGWKFDGISDYLLLQATYRQDFTLIIKYSNFTDTFSSYTFIGSVNTTSTMLFIGADSTDTPNYFAYIENDDVGIIDDIPLSSTMALNKNGLYSNGVLMDGTWATNPPSNFTEEDGELGIGAASDGSRKTQFYVQACTIYNVILTPTQIATVSAAMAAL